MRGFAERRMSAIEHLAHEFPGNRQTEKTPFDLPDGRVCPKGPLVGLLDALYYSLTRNAIQCWPPGSRPIWHRPNAGCCRGLPWCCCEELDQSPEFVETVRENARRRLLREQYTAAFLVPPIRSAFGTLTPAQKAETEPISLTAPYRLRIDLSDIDGDCATVLRLTNFSAGDRVILAQRLSVDERLPVEQQCSFIPTAKQLLYQPRVEMTAIHANGIVELLPVQPMGGGDGRYTFWFPPRTAYLW